MALAKVSQICIRQPLRTHLAHLWATCDFVPRSEAVEDPPGGKGYVATLPTCGPPLVLSPGSEAVRTPPAVEVV